MESHIAPKSNRLLKRFEFWTVSPSYEHPGWCVVTPNRHIQNDKELTSEERSELFLVVLPKSEGMLEQALGACEVRRHWVDGVYHLEPLTTPGQTALSAEASQHLFAVLVAASA